MYLNNVEWTKNGTIIAAVGQKMFDASTTNYYQADSEGKRASMNQ
jgi:hypothetical protein